MASQIVIQLHSFSYPLCSFVLTFGFFVVKEILNHEGHKGFHQGAQRFFRKNITVS